MISRPGLSSIALSRFRRTHPSLRTVGPDTLLLLDSGGQYVCGTTDITRCVHLGAPTPRQRLAYTRVLQVRRIYMP